MLGKAVKFSLQFYRSYFESFAYWNSTLFSRCNNVCGLCPKPPV